MSEAQDNRIADSERRTSYRVLGGWLLVAIVIWLGGWAAYAGALLVLGPNLFSDPSEDAIAHGGPFKSIPWAGIVGILCLLPLAVAVLRRGRQRDRSGWPLFLILVCCVTAYATGLVLLYKGARSIWGPYRYVFSASAAGETACWKQVPGTADLGGWVYALSATSSTDLWAVGQTITPAENASDEFPGESLTAHWDGQRLRVVASPRDSPLVAASSLSPTNVWAAGGDTKPLVEHWDGTRWRVVPTPALHKASLRGIAAQSGTDVWTVGSVSGGAPHPLIEHWDGKRWTAVRGRSTGRLYAVSATSADDAWSVGRQRGKLLIEHWDGRSWRRVMGASRAHGRLDDVAALSSTNVWVVGTVTEHWDGHAWRVVRSVGRGRHVVLHKISAVTPTDIWAAGVGDAQPARPFRNASPILEHWNGRAWRLAPTPNVSAGFTALAAVSPSEIWGEINSQQGGFITSNDYVLIERSTCAG